MYIQLKRLRVAAILIAFAAGLVLASLGVMGTISVQAASVQAAGDEEVKQADVIVQFNEHDVIIRPITFTGEISGFRALELTGLELEYSTEFGAPFVCSIEGIGCPATNCFCDADRSWGYWNWEGADWSSSGVGAAARLITQTGEIDGWKWGAWAVPQAPAPAPDVQAALRGLAWLQASQSITNGSYGGKVSPSLDVMLAVGANHMSADTWQRDAEAPSLMDFVIFAGPGYADDGVAESGRLAAAVSASEGCWPPDAHLPSTYYSDTLGSLSDQGGFLSWGIIGSLAISNSDVGDSVSYLQGLAQPNGGWEWSPGWGADTNSTAIAMQALIAGGVPVTATEIISGLAFLKTSQNDDGGFPYQPDSPFGTDSDSNSTAWVVQAIMAAGDNPRDPAWAKDGTTPIDFLLSTQLGDGSFEYQKGGGGDAYATRQVVQALLGSTYPMQVRDIVACDVESTMLPLITSGGEGPQ